LIGHIAIHNTGRSSLPQDARVRFDFAVLDGLQKVNLHFNGHDAGAFWGRQESGEAARRVCKHGQNPAVDDSVNLLMPIEDRHAENGPAMFGLHQLEAEMVDGIAVAQAFFRPRQFGL
jgi:hypothetical protein